MNAQHCAIPSLLLFSHCQKYVGLCLAYVLPYLVLTRRVLGLACLPVLPEASMNPHLGFPVTKRSMPYTVHTHFRDGAGSRNESGEGEEALLFAQYGMRNRIGGYC